MTDPLVVAKPIMLHQNRTLSVVQVSDFFFWSVPQSVSSRKLENDPNHWSSQSLGGKEDGCWCVWGGVSLVGWMLPQPQHPLSDELMCWGCVLWEGKCRVAGPDSSHCYVPSISFIGHEAGGKAGDCAGNVKSKCCGKEVGDGHWCHYPFPFTSHPVNFHWSSMGKTCSRSCTSTDLFWCQEVFFLSFSNWPSLTCKENVSGFNQGIFHLLPVCTSGKVVSGALLILQWWNVTDCGTSRSWITWI